MTWGAFYLYYQCPKCGKKFKYELDVLEVDEDRFGQCPDCLIEGNFIQDGPNTKDSLDYEELD